MAKTSEKGVQIQLYQSNVLNLPLFSLIVHKSMVETKTPALQSYTNAFERHVTALRHKGGAIRISPRFWLRGAGEPVCKQSLPSTKSLLTANQEPLPTGRKITSDQDICDSTGPIQ